MMSLSAGQAPFYREVNRRHIEIFAHGASLPFNCFRRAGICRRSITSRPTVSTAQAWADDHFTALDGVAEAASD